MTQANVKFTTFLIMALSSLIVIGVGCRKPAPIKLACNATPPVIYPGERVTVTANPTSVNTKKGTNVLYNWSGPGVSGNENPTSVDTGSLSAGDYTVKGQVRAGMPGKEGRRPWEVAECSTSFTIKEFEPPSISCSADPVALKPGETSTITANASSPQNRPLTYSYSATAGTISGSGSTALFSSAGAATGPVGITCDVRDDSNHSASARASVEIASPPLPPVPHAQSLCPVSFATDTKRPTRVSNEAKACLDSVALALQQAPDAKLVLVGDSNAKEKALAEKRAHKAGKHGQVAIADYAAQRGVNVKNYLVQDKGIDPSRINVAIGVSDDQAVRNYLVPAGADFAADVSETSAVDETRIKPQERIPLPERHRGQARSTGD